MGTIRDLADLIAQVSISNTDKIFAGELREIQTMITKIQLEQTGLVEKRIKLLRENEDLRKEIDDLNKEIFNLKIAHVNL